MNCVLIFLVVLSANFVDSSDEYVTIWTPNVINSGQDYNVVFLSSEIDRRTQISFKLCNSYATLAFASEKLQQFTFKSNQQISSAKNALIHITIHRNETNSNETRQMCMSHTINDVQVAQKQFHTFIQTDKPIYKAWNEVRFRIIIVDKNLKPYKPNNLQIKIIDPQGRTIREINEAGKNFKTVYTGSFILSIDTSFGVWKITTVIDKHHQWMTSKKFVVTGFKLPTFNAYITAKENHLLTNSVLQLGFYAKYSFEDFVRGNAQLTITCTTNNQVVLTKSFTDITGMHNVKYKVHDDLKAATTTRLDYTATIVFTEPESGIEANRTLKFSVHADNNPRIKPNHPDKFMPGLPFGIKVFVFDWKDELIKKTPERVKVSLDCVLQSGEERTLLADGIIKQGVAIINLIIPEDADSLTVRIKFQEVKYEKKIEKGLVVVGVNKIMVEYSPKNPKYGDVITAQVRADSELDQLIAVVMSRHGNIECHQVYCNYRLTCPFNITIRKNMMPEAKIVVYHVKDKKSIHQGEVTITTVELGKNTLDIEMPNYVEKRKKIDMKINTQPESTVYLLGFDKRLSSFFQGNEITKDDVVSELADYDGTNRVTVLDMDKSNWHDCTGEELRQIKKGIFLYWDSDARIYEDEIVCHEDNNFEELPTSDNTESIRLQDIEEDFRDVWMFEELKSIQMYEVPWTFEVSWMYGVPWMNRVPDERFIKSIYVPSSANTWIISSFSIHDEYGLAIGPPKELIVKNQFYIQAFLPYKIKFGEIIKVDVMVYNYVNNREALDVKITMFDSEKLNTFKFYDSECSLTPSNETKPSKTIKVQNENARKVSFYIQPTSSKQNFEERIKIRIDAIATSRHGERFEYKMIKSLRVEPVGVKTFNVISENYNLAKNSMEIVDYIENDLVNNDGYKRYITEVSGDYLTECNKLRSLRHYMYPSYSLEQKTSQLKERIEIFRYQKAKNLNPSVNEFSEIYQSILGQWSNNWNYKNTCSFIAYFVDTMGSAMETEVIPKDSAIITNGLDSLKASQTENGSFDNFGNFLEFHGDSESAQYFQTAFILIPFLKFRGFAAKKYDDVIDKGFNILNGDRNMKLLDKEALSVAAYVYALNDDKYQTQVLLNEVEESAVQIDENKKCYKLSENRTNCDLRHTAYAALAYITVNQVDYAKDIFKYILLQYKLRSYYGNDFNHVLSTEVISKYLFAKKDNTTTDFKVTFTSELGLESILNVTNSNQKDLHEFIFPDYTLHPKITINGTGVCSIRKIIESYTAVEHESSKFNVTVTPQPVVNQNERIVRVCATYQPQGNFNKSDSLFSVIYDVEMPSGYLYKEIVDFDKQTDIKLAAPKLARSRVQIYYNDFKQGTNYCVDIRAIKLWKLGNMQNAGVIVFDHNDNENTAISFYTFSSDDCEPANQVFINSTTEANRVDQVTSLWNSTNPFNVNSTKITKT